MYRPGMLSEVNCVTLQQKHTPLVRVLVQGKDITTHISLPSLLKMLVRHVSVHACVM